jgi:hypothetical protein
MNAYGEVQVFPHNSWAQHKTGVSGQFHGPTALALG